jgi:outer membrane cobalamin receptor
MLMVKRPFGCAICALFISTSVSSIARADDVSAIPEVTVTADRVDEPVNSTGSSVTVIPGTRLQQSPASR